MEEIAEISPFFFCKRKIIFMRSLRNIFLLLL